MTSYEALIRQREREITKAFRTYLRTRRHKEADLLPLAGVDLMFDFQRDVKYPWVDTDSSSDMLLFGYSTGKRTDGRRYFEIEIVRQLARVHGRDEDDDANLFQLRLTFLYDAARFETIETYSKWSREYPELGAFRETIHRSKGFRAVGSARPARVEIVTETC